MDDFCETLDKWSFFVHSPRSEEHTSELQSRLHLVCRLLLEKKKNTITQHISICNQHISYAHGTYQTPTIEFHEINQTLCIRCNFPISADILHVENNSHLIS